MPTIASGNQVEIYAPLTSSVTITPSAGYVEFGCSPPSGTDAPSPRKVYAAESITVPAGSTVFMRAIDGAATYTEPAGLNVALQSLEAGAGNINAPLIIAEYAQQLTRTSVNAAGDTSFAAMEAGGVTSSFVIPGGSMGPNGTLTWEIEAGNNNTAQIAYVRLEIGGVEICAPIAIAAGAANFLNMTHTFTNTAVAANKYRLSFSKNGSSTAGWQTRTINTSVDQTVNITCSWAAAVSGGVITLHRMRATVSYGA